ncbi:hypothetical protein ABPG72_021063 [Tetrahymena utriculariae]
MGRLNFFSSNCEALKNLGVSNEENLQLFLENCYINKVECSPLFSSIEFDQTAKRLAGTSSQLNLKFICKEIIIRQDSYQQKFNMRKKSSSYYQQNYEFQANNSQKSGTIQNIASQIVSNSPFQLLNKKFRRKSISKKNSTKNIELKQLNTKKLSTTQTNIQLKSGNEIKSAGYLINNNENNNLNSLDTVNQQQTQNYFNNRTVYSCFQGEIKQDDGVNKKVNIRIWNYKLIDDYVVICIEDQSFRQQFSNLKEKSIVMQFFLNHYLVKQEDLTKKSLAEQKFAYSHLKLPFYNLKKKTYTQQECVQGTFAQQYKNAMMGKPLRTQENSEAGMSVFDSNENTKQNKNQAKTEVYTEGINLNSSYQNNQNTNQHQNSHQRYLQQSSQNFPNSNYFINTDIAGSQIAEQNNNIVGEEKQLALSLKKQQKSFKKFELNMLESAETSIQLEQNNVCNQKEQKEEEQQICSNVLQPNNFLQNSHFLGKKYCSQIRQSFGDNSGLNSPNEIEKHSQKLLNEDLLIIQEEELAAKNRQTPKQNKQLKQSASLSPKQSNYDKKLHPINLRITQQIQQNIGSLGTPSSKRSKRSFTYHHNLQSGNTNLSVSNKHPQLPMRKGKQKFSLVRFLSNNLDKQYQASDNEEDSQSKVNKANVQLFSIGSRNSINSQIAMTPNKYIKSEQHSPTLLEKGKKPSIFLTLNRSPSELEKNKQESTNQEQKNHHKISQFINALRHTQKCEFYLYQAQSLTQNYSILQSFLFQNRSYKYQLLNTQILDLIKGILHVCQPLIEKKSIKVLIQDKNLENSNKSLYQDKERLSLMLFNILYNSLIYCKNKSQISIYFQSMQDLLKEEDNIQNSISIQDQLPSYQELYQDQLNMLQNTSIPKNYNKSQGNIMLSPNKQEFGQHINLKELQLGKTDSYCSSVNNSKDNSPTDPNQLKLIIVNECDDIKSSFHKIEECNGLTLEQLLQKAMQIVQTTNQNQNDQGNLNQQQQFSNQNTMNDNQKNPYQYMLKKRISQQFTPDIKQFSPQIEEIRHQKSLKPQIYGQFNVREPALSVQFNKLNTTQDTQKIGIVVAKFILKKIGPYEKILYSQYGSNQIKTELVIYKDLRLLEPEQPLKTRQTVHSYQQSQGSYQNIPIDRENKSKFYNSINNQNLNLQIKSISSKTFIQIPLAIQSNEDNIEKINNDAENSLSKQMIDQKIKRKFGQQPIYFEDINEKEKHNSSAVSEDFSKHSIPFERQISMFQSVNKTIDIKNNFKLE